MDINGKHCFGDIYTGYNIAKNVVAYELDTKTVEVWCTDIDKPDVMHFQPTVLKKS